MKTPARYIEIADDLRELILAEGSILGNRLVTGAVLPTEPELCEHYQVARATLRQALARLTAEGLLETRGRKGTFVRRLPVLTYPANAEDPDRQGPRDSWGALVERAGYEPSSDFDFRIVAASSAVAGCLQIEPHSLVVVRELERAVDETPWLAQTSYYPMDVARACGLDDPHDIEEGTVRRMAARGFREIRAENDISSRLATAEEADAFKMGAGLPVLVYRRLAFTAENRPVRLTVEILPADRNSVSWTVSRDAK